MFIFSNKYLEQINKLIAESDSLDCAVAFWGQGAEELLAHRKTKGKDKTRIICNLRSGATNPEVIKNLKKHFAVKQHDALHAKVIVGDEKAIVGSANFSCNGLNLEGSEKTGWEEAGILTTNSKEVEAIRKWFEAVWKHSHGIKAVDIEMARNLWGDRRGNRLITKASDGSLLDIPIDNLKNRPIYLAICRSVSLSSEAKSALNKVREREDTRKLYAYENWGSLPEGTLIELYYGPRGSLRCYGAYEIIPGLVEKITYANGQHGEIQICRRTTIKQMRFKQDDVTKLFEPVIEEILETMGGKGWGVIEIWKAIQIARSHR